MKVNTSIGNRLLTRIGAFVAATALILWFFPKEAEDSYTYEINRPWVYSLLTAPFDLPIHLDSIRAQEVRDSIERAFEPVYKRDVGLEKTIVSEYASRLNGMAADLALTPAQRNHLLTEIKSIYETGLVDAVTYAEIIAGRLPAVRMIHNNVAMSVPTVGYNSARSAYARLDSVFKEKAYHEAIRQTGLSDLLHPNIQLDTVENERLRREVYLKAMAPVGVIQQGERIIDKGELVTPQLYTVLQTYEEMSAERGARSTQSMLYPLLGQLLYIMIVLGSLYGFLYFFRHEYFDSIRAVLFLMLVITLFALVAFALSSAIPQGLYLVPFAMIPVTVLVFLDSRTAFFTHVMTVMLCAIIAPLTLEFMLLQMTAGVVAINSLKDLTRRSQLVRTAALVFLAYSLAYIAVELMHNGTPRALEPRMFGYFAINAVFISFAYVLIFVFEKIFGFTSRVTLVELSDINNPLLRELSEECPGTFQHSMSVSNLASEAAHRIGANVQLVRAGALYHDIGKIENPAFFTENQHGVNPHDALSPLQSARIVVGHVADGLKLADRAKLPQVIRNFISEHHGKGTARYFYTTWCNSHPGEEVDPAPFSYPGPNPQSRETSILMMADAVEAASRSLREHTPEAISQLVNRIIDSQISEGLHRESPLSFRDVTLIKQSFVSRLRIMYHSRISYPEAVKPGAGNQASGTATAMVVGLLMAAGAFECSAVNIFPKLKTEKPDMEQIWAETTDRTSPYYYPRLLEQYAKNDTVMKIDKYRRLYLGYMLQEDYDPYRASYPVPQRIIALYGKENPTRAECDSIIKYATLSLENQPFDMIQIDALIDALRAKGNTSLASIWEYKQRYLLMAIVSTGSGLDEESAWFVCSPQHEYYLLNAMGYKVDNHLFYEPFYEYITVEDAAGRQAGGYYFNLEPMLKEYYHKHPDDLEYDSDTDAGENSDFDF